MTFINFELRFKIFSTELGMLMGPKSSFFDAHDGFFVKNHAHVNAHEQILAVFDAHAHCS